MVQGGPLIEGLRPANLYPLREPKEIKVGLGHCWVVFCAWGWVGRLPDHFLGGNKSRMTGSNLSNSRNRALIRTKSFRDPFSFIATQAAGTRPMQVPFNSPREGNTGTWALSDGMGRQCTPRWRWTCGCVHTRPAVWKPRQAFFLQHSWCSTAMIRDGKQIMKMGEIVVMNNMSDAICWNGKLHRIKYNNNFVWKKIFFSKKNWKSDTHKQK